MLALILGVRGLGVSTGRTDNMFHVRGGSTGRSDNMFQAMSGMTGLSTDLLTSAYMMNR